MVKLNQINRKLNIILKAMNFLIMVKKRIYNPKTRKYYKLRERTTSQGRKGQILGSYKPKPKKTKKGWFEELFG